MRSFRIKQGIDGKVFYYVRVYYFGISWDNLDEIGHSFLSSICGTKIFENPEGAKEYIIERYGKSARIKTTW